MRGLELLNVDETHFSVRTLFNRAKPSALSKEKDAAASGEKDWIETDTDEQLLLYTPFNSAIKLHTIQVHDIIPSNRLTLHQANACLPDHLSTA